MPLVVLHLANERKACHHGNRSRTNQCFSSPCISFYFFIIAHPLQHLRHVNKVDNSVMPFKCCIYIIKHKQLESQNAIESTQFIDRIVSYINPSQTLLALKTKSKTSIAMSLWILITSLVFFQWSILTLFSRPQQREQQSHLQRDYMSVMMKHDKLYWAWNGT